MIVQFQNILLYLYMTLSFKTQICNSYNQKTSNFPNNTKMQVLIFCLILFQLSTGMVVQLPSKLRREKCQIADTIYTNGNIITMDSALPTAKFLAIKDDKIIKVTTKEADMFCHYGNGTKIINLHGKSMTPGFVDAHSHFSLTAVRLSQPFSISPPPFGNVTSIRQMLQNAKNYIKVNSIPEGQKVYATGYSDYAFQEHRHPTKYQLDWISDRHPIVFQHYSAHVLVANSMALSLAGFSQNGANQQYDHLETGGVIQRYPNGTMTGVLKEIATVSVTDLFATKLADLTQEQILKTVERYFSVGVTTAQDTMFSMMEPKVYKQLGDDFPLQINTYYWVSTYNLTHFHNVMKNYRTKRVHPRGAKFILDGSIQGYTALLSQPYWVPKEKQYQDLENYTYDSNRTCTSQNCGENSFPSLQLLQKLFLTLNQENYDVIAHCNGDAALDNFLKAIQHTRKKQSFETEARFVSIHTQNMRDDQLDKMASLGRVSPSFFSPHISFWGDQHYKIFLGPERANRMNPAKSAAKRGLLYTLHNDSPVILNGVLDGKNTFMSIIEAAVNRKTPQGRVLGSEQKLTPYEALAGVTINSAKQSREEKRKGSITKGKIADLLILSGNPLDRDTSKLKDIQVLTTIKDGKVVYGAYPKEDALVQ